MAIDWENGWLGEDGYTWVNPPAAVNTDAGQGAGAQQQMSAVRTPPPGAGSTLVRQSRQSTSTRNQKDVAPAANTVFDNNGQLIQLNADAEEFQWGIGGGG